MCVAVPAKVIEVNGDMIKADIRNNIFEANAALVSVHVGDYVLIHAGCVLEVLKKDAAEEILWIFNELEEALEDDLSEDNR